MRKNVPQFEGDPIVTMLDERGHVPRRKVLRSAVIAGLFPVGLLAALVWLGLLGRIGLIVLLPFVWLLAWRFGGQFVDSAHDVDFRRQYAEYQQRKS